MGKWLLMRIVLQPLRTGTVFAGTWRTYQMQNEVEDMPVDFSCLSPSNSTSSFVSCGNIELAVRSEVSPRRNPDLTSKGLGVLVLHCGEGPPATDLQLLLQRRNQV